MAENLIKIFRINKKCHYFVAMKAVYTEEVRGYGMSEHTEPVFYIEVEEDE